MSATLNFADLFILRECPSELHFVKIRHPVQKELAGIESSQESLAARLERLSSAGMIRVRVIAEDERITKARITLLPAGLAALGREHPAQPAKEGV